MWREPDALAIERNAGESTKRPCPPGDLSHLSHKHKIVIVLRQLAGYVKESSYNLQIGDVLW